MINKEQADWFESHCTYSILICIFLAATRSGESTFSTIPVQGKGIQFIYAVLALVCIFKFIKNYLHNIIFILINALVIGCLTSVSFYLEDNEYEYYLLPLLIILSIISRITYRICGEKKYWEKRQKQVIESGVEFHNMDSKDADEILSKYLTLPHAYSVEAKKISLPDSLTPTQIKRVRNTRRYMIYLKDSMHRNYKITFKLKTDKVFISKISKIAH